jgi:hypothetical protein
MVGWGSSGSLGGGGARGEVALGYCVMADMAVCSVHHILNLNHVMYKTVA